MAVTRCGVVRREHETCDCNSKVLQREIVTLPGTCKALSGRPGVLYHGRPVYQGPSGFLRANWGRVLPSK